MKTLLKKFKAKIAYFLNYYRLSKYLFKVRQDIELYPILRSYLGEFPLCLFSEPLLWLKMSQKGATRFEKAEQRPYAFYSPHLSASLRFTVFQCLQAIASAKNSFGVEKVKSIH